MGQRRGIEPGLARMGIRAVIAQVTGAVTRAFLVVLLIATPALLLPGTSADATQIVALVAVFAAALTLFEYMSIYPGLIEFRDAPPFNRIRFCALFITVFFLSAMFRGLQIPTVTGQFLTAVGLFVGYVLDFAFSPVHLFAQAVLPGGTAVAEPFIRGAAGLAYVLSIISVCLFSLIVRFSGWPLRNGDFNLWINLPTFDPTAGDDVVRRLGRLAWFNVGVGILLPFVLPAVVYAVTKSFGLVHARDPQTLIWMVTAWALFPSGLIMRGVALHRIVQLIEQQRQRAAPGEAEPLLQPV